MTRWREDDDLDKLKVFPLTIIADDSDLELKLYANGYIKAVKGKVEELEETMEDMENYYYGAGGLDHVVLWLVAQINKLREEK